jgi:drug/metabolite transporter superfamily protein YnfA
MPKAYVAFAYLTFFSSLIPILTGILKFRSVDQGAKLVIYLLSFGFLIDLFTFWPILGYKIIPWFSRFYFLAEFITILFIFSLWQHSKKAHKIKWLLMGAFSIFWIAAILTFEPFNTPCIITAAVSRIILTLAAAYTLYIVFENSNVSLSKNQRFWILLSFIFNFSGTLLPIIFVGVLFGHSRESLYIAWSITWCLAIISDILFTIGFLCPQTQT